jgi:hypothetical protein
MHGHAPGSVAHMCADTLFQFIWGWLPSLEENFNRQGAACRIDMPTTLNLALTRRSVQLQQ